MIAFGQALLARVVTNVGPKLQPEGAVSSSEREMIRSIGETFGVGFVFLLVWAGMTFALSGLVSEALAAGLALGVALLLLAILLLTRLWRRLVARLERPEVADRDEPQGLPVQPLAAAAAPLRDLP